MTNSISVSDRAKEIVKEEHLTYLDGLRGSGVTNMFEAVPYLIKEFDVDRADGTVILLYWMETFAERQNAHS